MSPFTIRRRRALLVAALASGLSWRARAAASAPDAGAPPTPDVPSPAVRSRLLGMNLAPIAYWTTEFPFADLVKNSSGWSPRRRGQAQDAAPLTFAPDGYPARLEPEQSAALAVAWENSGYPSGEYVVRWEGEGELGFPLTEAKVVSRAPGRIVLEVSKRSGPIFVSIEKTRPDNPVRALRVLWPGTEATHLKDPFNPVFLQRLAPFGALRFMDWGRTNNSSVTRWSQRPLRDQLTWAEGVGVPVETMIDLANRLDADPWICVPHAADDDYLQSLAELLKARLDPRRMATVEYSNEVWNGSFRQTGYCVEQARRAGLPVPSNLGSIWYAERTLQIANVLERVYGPTGRRRWRTIVGGQAAWTRFAEDALAWKDVAKRVDALAIAPYFEALGDPPDGAALMNVTPEQLLERMRAHIRGETRRRIAANARLAATHKLKLVAYEAGPSDVTASIEPTERRTAITARVAQAHASPAMRAVYRECLEAWFDAGGELLNHYCDVGSGGVFGFWGALERVTQDPATAPKYLALLDAVAAHPLAPR
jgi:hypothetical protein